ncbi:hypothetical protein [Leekyejoonella antrihumi]|uniref:Uncharacterized protein n=1 Tax=Leekyejoonella antrihumi TaxID=1660198 RepID=A0A563DW21_9MICO|nr:hypothetical protein [Leekyejoonella antrihumi]TWP34478.1 hypothetical protein FGL98_17340 [Leekyejoonella antrihumi]
MGYNKAWEVQYSRDRARGIRRYVPAERTRARLEMLVTHGASLRTLAKITELSGTAIGQIIAGRRAQVQSRTARRVKQLRLRDVYGDQADGLVPSLGALRRVRALRALGWDGPSLTAAGAAHTNQLLAARRDHITIGRWRQIDQVYERLSMTPGPSPAARRRARHKGWPPPLAWDEDTIDDPGAKPCELAQSNELLVDEVAIRRAVFGDRATLHPAEQATVITTMAAQALSDRQIASATNRSPRTALRIRKRLGTPSQWRPCSPAR